MSLYDRIEHKIDGVSFKGKVYVPKVLSEAKGIIIFTHGLGYCDRQYSLNGDYFSENGYLFVTYNLRGHAGNQGEWTLRRSVKDISELISFLCESYKFFGNKNIILMGHSTGALISILSALEDKRVCAASLVTIVTSLEDSYKHWFVSKFNIEVKKFFASRGFLPPIIDKFTNDAGMLRLYKEKKISTHELDIPHRYGMLQVSSFNDFFNEIAYSADIFKFVDNIDIPIVLFRGKDDEVMDPEKTTKLFDLIKARVRSKLVITQSRDHFQSDSWDQIQRETIDFLNADKPLPQKLQRPMESKC